VANGTPHTLAQRLAKRHDTTTDLDRAKPQEN